MSTQSEMLAAWLNGTATGGPNGDGRYPLIYADGQTYLVYSPAAQALNPALAEQPVEIFAEAAEASATTANTAATNAQTYAQQAQTSAANAASSATTANTHKNAAATSATNAATSATTASTAATNAGTSETNAAASATTASNASTTAVAARDKAQLWADASQDVIVEGTSYSAKHWAQKAQAAVTGTLKYKGSWDATTAFPANPVLGDFWKVSVAGNGYNVGDQILFNGAGWDKIDNTEAVMSVAGRTGAVTLGKADVGLGNVDNTSDAAKPISTATQTALNSKANLTGAGFSGTVGFPSAGGSFEIKAGNADAASYTQHNTVIKSWWGIGMVSFDDVVRGYYDSRTGTWDTKGGYKVDGQSVWYPGNFNPAAKVDIKGDYGVADANLLGGGFYGGYLRSGTTQNTPAGSWTSFISVMDDAGVWGFQIGNNWFSEELFVRSKQNGSYLPWRSLWHNGNTPYPLMRRLWRYATGDSTSIDNAYNEHGFNYATGGGLNGPFISFGQLDASSGYQMQINGDYATGNARWRTRNGDSLTWSVWRSFVGSDDTVQKIVKMTQAAYNALGTKDANTLYIIVG